MADDAAVNVTTRRARLADRRKALGLTQEGLAELLDIDRRTVARWESGGANPLPWMRPKLARALKISPERIEALLAGPESAGPGGATPAVPRQLPAAVPDFTGRAAELQALTQMLEEAAAGAPGTVLIAAISGTAGVGKTALAVYWAHQVAARFDDGQLHVNLRGFDASGFPATPAEAILGFLDALGAPPERIPPQLDAQAALYRSMLAGKRMLIMLDNARDEHQVRPLLPASPGCLVIVTSRSQLAGLVAANGARPMSLDILAHGEAVQLLTARVGRARVAAEPEAAAEVASLCACLPLALAVAAARAAARPGFSLTALAAELRDAAGRLDALDGGDQADGVRAVISWSYRQLGPVEARLFRLLAVHPGPDISAAAAASLAGTGEREARRVLRELAHAHLITEHVPGRYAFHDLLRAYAADKARAVDGRPDRDEAMGRVLDHYLHTADHASLLLHPAQEPIALGPPRTGTTPERLADQRQALDWFEAEQYVLLAATSWAAGSGFTTHAWQIVWAIIPFLTKRERYRQWAASRRLAKPAVSDAAGKAMYVRVLTDALNTFGDYGYVLGLYAYSLQLYRGLGDRPGEARIYQGLGYVAERQGRYADALGYAEQALRVFQELGDGPAEADMLNSVAWCHALLGDFPRARAFCRRSLARCAELGERHVEGKVWDSLGYIEHRVGNFGEAAACYQRAIRLFSEFGDHPYEAETLTRLGETHRAAGELPWARQAWQQALAILDDLGHPDADQVRAELDGMDEWAG